jgi:V/A-type H+-transporting ATPase subunit I
MGLMILGASEQTVVIALLVIPAVLVIFAGHIGNILLAGLAVLVHGIRLNTLEFSNHMALQWLGHVYKPFKKKEDPKLGSE